jgi:surfactin synthase thioesterase subunit
MRVENLFCFPFAGGGALAYRDLEPAVSSVPMCTVELPGRGRRFGEPLLADLDAMVEDLLQQIADRLQSPYALYGHSMGGLLAYLAARRAVERSLPPPQVLCVSGAKGPVAVSGERRHLLPRREFFEMLRELGGCPDEILADAELMELYEPILRADFAAIAGYRHRETPPLDLPIVVLTGTHDSVREEDALQWQRETTRPIRHQRFAGGHFFIFSHRSEIRLLLAEYLDPAPARIG